MVSFSEQTHSPAVQVLFDGQAPQAVPGFPHAAVHCSLGAMHVLSAQQPLGHEVLSHVQLPPEQRCPAPHFVPQPPQLLLSV
jgi:hypothetical protein